MAHGQKWRRSWQKSRIATSCCWSCEPPRRSAAEAYRCGRRPKLTAARTAAAAKLEKLAEAHINDLAMKARFAVQVTAQEAETHWTRQGWDFVDCRIATNAGEPLKPLEQIASGGELSRVMLALKVSVEEGAARGQKAKLLFLVRWSSMRSTSALVAGPRRRWGKN